MILCAERFDREQTLAWLPTFGGSSALSSTSEERFPSGDWAQRQTQMRGFDTMTLFPNEHGRRSARRAITTTS